MGSMEAPRSERHAGAGVVGRGVESVRGSVTIFRNGGRIDNFGPSSGYDDASRVLIERRRGSLGNIEVSRSERCTGAGAVGRDIESVPDTAPIFRNGGRIDILDGASFTTHQHAQSQTQTKREGRTPRTRHTAKWSTRRLQILATQNQYGKKRTVVQFPYWGSKSLKRGARKA